MDGTGLADIPRGGVYVLGQQVATRLCGSCLSVMNVQGHGPWSLMWPSLWSAWCGCNMPQSLLSHPDPWSPKVLATSHMPTVFNIAEASCLVSLSQKHKKTHGVETDSEALKSTWPVSACP